MPRIYLDNAATSFPKPESVYAAVDRYQRELGTAVGRGATRIGAQVQRIVDQCRTSATRFFDASSPDRIILTQNGTHALNLAIQGLLRSGDRVLTTVWDHNSVLRPLKALEEQRQVRREIIHSDGAGGIDLEALEKALSTPTRMVVMTHASNVTGIVQPVQEVVQLAHAAGALVLLDAAQTAGHLPVQLRNLGVDLVATPGHKGLLGPLGTGLLIFGREIEDQLQPLFFGGTGTSSESDRQPETLPDRYESGNLNAPGIVGLAAAFEWLEEHHFEDQHQQQLELSQQLQQGLQELPHVRVPLAESTHPRVPLTSFCIDRMAPQVAASLLDQHFEIEVRAGFHCAPLAHAEIGTQAEGGTIRVSLGPFNTSDDVDQLLEAVAQIVAAI